MTLSVFDIFKVGIGPSSSHTMGPMRAAREFVVGLQRDGLLERVAQIAVRLYGSLALTGAGHGTDRAVLVGLEGANPETVDPDSIETTLQRIRSTGRINLLGTHPVVFDEPMQLLFMYHERLPHHSNGMRFTALDANSQLLREEDYYSIGGGFIVKGDESEARDTGAHLAHPYPFTSGEDLLALSRAAGLEIYELVLANERVQRTHEQVRAGLLHIWSVMQACVERGFRQTGLLPGVLKVRRRAPKLYRVLTESSAPGPLDAMDWVNAYALAVNEENAAGGRVVTAPTNGAAGIIPAVLHFYTRFERGANDEGVIRFLLTAAAMGMLYKRNASISGAEMGCQGEVGVACGGRPRCRDAWDERAGRERSRNRDGAQPGIDLRPRCGSGADSVHRAQRHGRGESHQRGPPRDARRRHSQSVTRSGDRDHAPDGGGHVDDLQGDFAGRVGRQRAGVLGPQR
jgi:L-serine dehydratase